MAPGSFPGKPGEGAQPGQLGLGQLAGRWGWNGHHRALTLRGHGQVSWCRALGYGPDAVARPRRRPPKVLNLLIALVLGSFFL